MLNLKFYFKYVILFICALQLRVKGVRNQKDDRGESMINELFNDLRHSTENLKSRILEYREINEMKNLDLPMFDIRYDDFPDECKTHPIPKDCAEATSCTLRNGIYKIRVEEFSNESFLVECDVKTEDGDWIVIQRRQDGSVDFNLNWAEYKHGFGNIDGEFFIGLDKLHALTNYNGPQELKIMFESKKLERHYANYNSFVVGNFTEMYTLKQLGKFSGTAGDSMFYHLGMKFSTKDRDHDKCSRSCPEFYKGGFWFNDCHRANPNGNYTSTNPIQGIQWRTFREQETMRYFKMMIRRRRN